MEFIEGLSTKDISGFLKVLSELYSYGLKDEVISLLQKTKKHLSDFISSGNFKLLPMVIIQRILGRDDLTLTEEILWDNCVAWAKYRHEKSDSIEEWLDAPSEFSHPKKSNSRKKKGGGQKRGHANKHSNFHLLFCRHTREKRRRKPHYHIDIDKHEYEYCEHPTPTNKQKKKETKKGAKKTTRNTDYQRRKERITSSFSPYPIQEG